ncbi:CHC2 zinc finger domain-containing protein [Fodinicurvata fenggangensis]|uniref:CHC2 zinc finger domain-containing protein n=1 Tax=Fodinicurvata fenggangensis TaxID=1121830 RepID=UPI000479266D|nr:CHC2 zinc finger domain-containing protein [Fodinicurvata fenggangensis]
MTDRRDTEARVTAVKDRLELAAVAERLGLPLKRRGRERVACCPFHNERTPSFKIREGQDFFHCFGCGAHGDVLELAQRLAGLSFGESLELLEDMAGLARLPEAQRTQAEARAKARAEEDSRRRLAKDQDARHRQSKRVLDIWRGAGPIAGTLAERYLANRLGLDPADFALIGGLPASLRCHAALPYWGEDERGAPVQAGSGPALVAAVQGPGCRAEGGGQITAVHCTWLFDGTGEADGKGRRIWGRSADGQPWATKKIIGRYSGGALRLTAGGAEIVTAEGIETTLALYLAMAQAEADGQIRELPSFWAALSLNNLAGPGDSSARRVQHPQRPWVEDPRTGKQRRNYLPARDPDLSQPGLWLPPGCATWVIAEDSDNKDPDSARAVYDRAERRGRHEGRRVRRTRPPEGLDFADWYVRGGAVTAGEAA